MRWNLGGIAMIKFMLQKSDDISGGSAMIKFMIQNCDDISGSSAMLFKDAVRW